MTRLLIIYGTTDGQTAKIATFLRDKLQSRGAAVDVMDARSAAPNPSHYDAVIVAASIQAGGYQRPLVSWVRTHASELQSMPAAFITVCLGILEKDDKVLRRLEEIKAQFIATTRWTPPITKFVAGALRYTKYGWLKRMIMRNIARKAGGDTDVSRDHEYTDWADLEAFATTFLAGLPAPEPEACSCSSSLEAQAGMVATKPA